MTSMFTFDCLVCREERPDHLISVEKIYFQTDPRRKDLLVQLNARYCNDRPECEAAVKNLDIRYPGVPHALPIRVDTVEL